MRLAAVFSSAERLASVLWLCAGVLYLATEGVAADAFSPTYSYAHNYISDLGVPTCGAVYAGRSICSPLHALMNGNFALQGLAFLAAALAIARSIEASTRVAFVAFAALNGLGNIVIALFPETMPGPIAGFNFHVAGALLAILFGNATALVSTWTFSGLGLAPFHRLASIALTILAAIALAILVASPGPKTAVLFPSGIWERISVYTITAWEFLSAACVLARHGSSRQSAM